MLESAHRALGNCGQVFRYAIATERAERDPSGDLCGALPSVKGEHFAAITEPKRVAELSWLTVAEWALTQRTRGKSVLFSHHSGKDGAAPPSGKIYWIL